VLTQTSREVLTQGSLQTCGGTGPSDRPNNLWGYGLIDAYAAAHLGPDGDGDGIASPCDCAPNNAGAFGAPPEGSGLAFSADKSTLSWTPLAPLAGSATVYDAIRGDLGALRASGLVSAAACLGGATTATSRADAQTPGPGAGFYYIVQPRNACGSGGWGAASDGTPRAHGNCS